VQFGPEPETVRVAQFLDRTKAFAQRLQLIGTELLDALAMADPRSRQDRGSEWRNQGSANLFAHTLICQVLLSIRTVLSRNVTIKRAIF
jgi:hypothetical protein